MKRRLIVVGMLIAVFMTIIVFLVILPSESYRRYQLEKVGDFSGPEYVADGSLFTDLHTSYFTGGLDIEELRLGDTKITEVGLRRICELGNLKKLVLSNVELSDTDLLCLSPLDGLRQIYLRGTDVTGLGLSYLRLSENPYLIDLDNTKISDEGLNHLSHLKSCTFLRLAETAVTSAGVSKLVDIEIESLDLSRSQINDDIWETLMRADGFYTVRLSGCDLNGSEMQRLASWTNLNRLDLSVPNALALCKGLGIISGQELDDRTSSSGKAKAEFSEDSQLLSLAYQHFSLLRKLGKQVRVDGQINEAALRELRGLATLANKDPEDGEVLEGILGYLERRSPCFRSLDITKTKIPKHRVEALKLSLPSCHIAY